MADGSGGSEPPKNAKLRAYLSTLANSNVNNNNTNKKNTNKASTQRARSGAITKHLGFREGANVREFLPTGEVANLNQRSLTNNTKNTRGLIKRISVFSPFYDPSLGPDFSQDDVIIDRLTKLFHQKKLEHQLNYILHYYKKKKAEYESHYKSQLTMYKRTDPYEFYHLNLAIKEASIHYAIEEAKKKYMRNAEEYKSAKELRSKKLASVRHSVKNRYGRVHKSSGNLPLFRNNLNTLSNERNTFFTYTNIDAFEQAQALAQELTLVERAKLRDMANLTKTPEVQAAIDAQKAQLESPEAVARRAEVLALRPAALSTLRSNPLMSGSVNASMMAAAAGGLNKEELDRQFNADHERLKALLRKQKEKEELSKKGHNPAANEWVPSWMRGPGGAGGNGGAAGGAGGEGGAAGGGQGGGKRKTRKTKKKTRRKH
jgi:hypothetical protein